MRGQTISERVLLGLHAGRDYFGAALRTVVAFSKRKPLAAAGGAVLVFAILIAFIVWVSADLITPHNPRSTTVGESLDGPNTNTLLGTDQLGRDLLSRLIVATRVSMFVGVASVLIAISLGTMVGILSAYLGGLFDLLIQRLVDALMAFPALVLALAIMATLGASEKNVIIALVVVFVPGISRTIRSQALGIMEMDYVLAARAVGAGMWRIVLRHLIPNTLATAIILMSLTLGWAIVVEASLSFLGLGTPVNIPSWGGMLNRGATHWMSIAPLVGIMPGLAIVIVVFAANYLGDGLRDELDPRMRGTEN